MWLSLKKSLGLQLHQDFPKDPEGYLRIFPIQELISLCDFMLLPFKRLCSWFTTWKQMNQVCSRGLSIVLPIVLKINTELIVDLHKNNDLYNQLLPFRALKILCICLILFHFKVRLIDRYDIYFIHWFTSKKLTEATAKPGQGRDIQVPPVGGRGSSTWAITIFFSFCLSGNIISRKPYWKQRSQNPNQALWHGKLKSW